MIKKHNVIKKIFSILAASIICSISPMLGYGFELVVNNEISQSETQEYIASGTWTCENGIIVELADNILTISGSGIPGKDVTEVIAKKIIKKS